MSHKKTQVRRGTSSVLLESLLSWVLSYQQSPQQRLIRLGVHSFCWFSYVMVHYYEPAHEIFVLILFSINEDSGSSLCNCADSTESWLLAYTNMNVDQFRPQTCCICQHGCLHGWKFSGFILNSGFWGWLSIESQPQHAELGRL